jgi:hypothetical protein
MSEPLSAAEYRRKAEEMRVIALDFWRWGMPGYWVAAKVCARLRDLQAWLATKARAKAGP